MKIKFEVKPKNTGEPLFTIFMEDRLEDKVELLITKPNIRQLNLPDKNPVATKSDLPISDGVLVMNKANLKKFISALQLLAKP